MTNIFAPRRVSYALELYADSEGPDQPAHVHSLIRTFVVRLWNHWAVILYLHAQRD